MFSAYLYIVSFIFLIFLTFRLIVSEQETDIDVSRRIISISNRSTVAIYIIIVSFTFLYYFDFISSLLVETSVEKQLNHLEGEERERFLEWNRDSLPHPPSVERVMTSVLFLGLLPLVNAQFDFLSAAATRFCLRKGVQSGPTGQVGWGMIDLFVGVFIFIFLCLTAVMVAHSANVLAGEIVLDLPAIFADPAGHRWLFLAFLTTLIPTFLHLLLWTISLAVAWPEKLRHWCAHQLSEYHLHGKRPDRARFALVVMAGTAGLCAALCVFAIRLVWMASQSSFDIGHAIVSMCEGWYGLLLA